MSLRKMLYALGVLLGAATPSAYAQYYNYSINSDNPIQWHVDFGMNIPTGSNSDLLNTGWNFGFGVTFRQPGAPFGLRLDVVYTSNNVSSQGVYQAAGATKTDINGGWVDGWAIIADGEYRHHFNDQVYVYGIAGIGGYYNRIQLTEVGFGYICNPWWYYCYYGTGNAVVVSNSATNFGWNAGLGVGFKLQGGASLFVEARYTWVDNSNTKLEYIPLVFGVRF
jgi:opacity protein-like surface antigen